MTDHANDRRLIGGLLRQHGAADRWSWRPGERPTCELWREVRQVDPLAELTWGDLWRIWRERLSWTR